MADEEPQGQEDTSWWAPDASTDPSLPSTGFDEPLVWPDSLAWDGPAEDAAGAPAPPPPDVIDPDGEFLFPSVPDLPPGADLGKLPDLDAAWQPPGAAASEDAHDDADATVHHSEPLGGLGGGSGWQAPASEPLDDARLPESIWADADRHEAADALVVTSTLASPTVYAEPERGSSGPRWRRFDVRSGNAAVIALISLVSLVLLGMFLSVRGRDDVRTDVSQQSPPGDQIAVTSPLNTVPFNPTTTSATTGGINIAELIPATEPTEPSSGPAATTATTAAPTRSTAPATTVPATQPTTATTAAPATTTPTTPTTAPPVDNTQPSTTRRNSTSSSFTVPTFPTTSVPSNTPTSFPFPFPFP